MTHKDLILRLANNMGVEATDEMIADVSGKLRAANYTPGSYDALAEGIAALGIRKHKPGNSVRVASSGGSVVTAGDSAGRCDYNDCGGTLIVVGLSDSKDDVVPFCQKCRHIPLA